jgi:PhnB protein
MEKTHYTVNEAGNVLTSERSFNAPREKVWTAWTTKEALEQWWAPKPWRAGTKSFEFREGGHWHYYMAGPEGEIEWCFMDYLTITPEEAFTATDFFCDEEGTPRPEMPSNKWNVHFFDEEGGTKIIVTTTYDTPEGLQTVIDMGMKEGFAMALQNLEELLTSS